MECEWKKLPDRPGLWLRRGFGYADCFYVWFHTGKPTDIDDKPFELDSSHAWAGPIPEFTGFRNNG
jgi:hypothetical protein